MHVTAYIMDQDTIIGIFYIIYIYPFHNTILDNIPMVKKTKKEIPYIIKEDPPSTITATSNNLSI